MCDLQFFALLWLIILAIPPLGTRAQDNGQDDSQDDRSDVIELDEIIVSATRTPASLDNTSASSSVVSEQQIRSSTATDLGHLLATTNILGISDYGPGVICTASMRGSSAEQVLVLMDGERINDSRNGGADLDNVPITHAHQIEIVRGGQSAMYGADAVGGIINIITRQPTSTAVRAWSALGDYSSLSLLDLPGFSSLVRRGEYSPKSPASASLGLEVSERMGAVSWLISFSQAHTEADFPFEDKYGRELVRENAGFTKRSLLGKLRWDISSATVLRLSRDYYNSDKGDPGSIGQYSPLAAKKEESNGLKADLEQSLRERGFCKFSVYKRDAALRYTNPQGPYPTDDTHRTDAVGAELQVHILRNTSIPLICGTSFRNEDITSTAFGERGRETYSGYIQQELSRDFHGDVPYLSRIAVFPALRWDQCSDFEAGISPKIGFLASLGRYRTATIKANIGRSYRAPTLNELYWPPDAFASGNPDLEPERAKDGDAGVYFHLPEPSILEWLSDIRCGVSYFRNSFRNRIQWNPGAGGKWSPQNLSKARSTGLEAEIRVHASFWDLPDLLSLRADYTFLKAEDMLERQLIYRPRHSLGYTVRMVTGGLWVQIQGLYNSRRYYTVQNTKWLEPFMRHDLQLGIERRLHNTADLDLVLEIKNILGEKYQRVADYPLPGREWSLKTSIGMEGE